MEILEFLIAGPEFCGCMLEMITAAVDIAAAVKTQRVRQRYRDRKEAIAAGEAPPPQPSWFPWIALVVAAVFFTVLLLWKWLRAVAG